ncbi:MAG: hypothetical protein J6U69_05385 [Alistipes sp.]|nr:hypothetical protein [Alistipes sp.]
MKRCLTLLAVALIAASCCNNGNEIVIKEQEAVTVSSEKSVELATKVIEAKSYEEFKAARTELEAYEEALRTQIGGEDYDYFVTTCNEILGQI